MSKAWRNGSTAGWRRLRMAVLQRDNFTCQLRYPGCTTKATVAAHKLAKSRGGKDVPGNLVASCLHCNQQDQTGPADPAPRIKQFW